MPRWGVTAIDRKPPVVAVDLFAGAGGLSLGAEMAGASVLLATDVWPEAQRTYEYNRADRSERTTFVCRPIQNLGALEVLAYTGLGRGELDLLLGGPPCQGFSINAPSRSASDSRNSLVREYLRLVEGLYPKYLVIENVPGLLSLDAGVALRVVYAELDRLGYDVQHRVLLAAWYGVPQERWRLIVLGRRRDVCPVAFPRPGYKAAARANFTNGAQWVKLSSESIFDGPAPRRLMKRGVTVADAIGDLPALQNGQGADTLPMGPWPDDHQPTPFQRWARMGANKLRNHTAPKLADINLRRMCYVRPGGSWREIPEDLLPDGMKRARRSDHTKRYGRLDPSGLSGTILTKCDPHWGSFFHYSQDRAITPREAARLQSFPDRYAFEGSQAAQYEQVGNAVPPLLARAVVCEVIRAVSQLTGASTKEVPLAAE